MQTVAPDTPDDGGRVHILVGYLPCQQLPKHHTKRPTAGRGMGGASGGWSHTPALGLIKGLVGGVCLQSQHSEAELGGS